jgi:hypothetical protein
MNNRKEQHAQSQYDGGYQYHGIVAKKEISKRYAFPDKRIVQAGQYSGYGYRIIQYGYPEIEYDQEKNSYFKKSFHYLALSFIYCQSVPSFFFQQKSNL